MDTNKAWDDAMRQPETLCIIEMPFPPASLSGHAKGHWRGKAGITRKWREDAFEAALAVKPDAIPAEGDLRVHVRFVPPDRRGDRLNYWNRCKPIFDGIADGLGVNDKRFLPTMEHLAPRAPGWIEVEIMA